MLFLLTYVAFRTDDGFSGLLYADWSNQRGSRVQGNDDHSRQIYPSYGYREGKSVKSGSYRLFSLVYLFLVKHFFSTNADFVVSFRNQLVIKDSFTDFNVGTMKWIVVETNTRVNWILKEVW